MYLRFYDSEHNFLARVENATAIPRIGDDVCLSVEPEQRKDFVTLTGWRVRHVRWTYANEFEKPDLPSDSVRYKHHETGVLVYLEGVKLHTRPKVKA